MYTASSLPLLTGIIKNEAVILVVEEHKRGSIHWRMYFYNMCNQGSIEIQKLHGATYGQGTQYYVLPI